MSESVKTLGRVIEDSEATFFVGRETELARLRQAFAGARERPGAVYVYGPPGVGKSALLRAFARELQQRKIPVVMIDGAAGERTRLQLRDAFASQLQVPLDGGETADGLAEALNAGARDRGAALVVDAYDELMDSDGWLRNHVFRHLGAGVFLVLAGRLRPAQLWSGDMGWTKAVADLRLNDLDAAEVAEFLADCGIGDAAVSREVYEITGGRPQLLCLAANALLLQPMTASSAPGVYGRREADRLALFLVEHILHPGSRRRTWRAGVGASQMDNVVAAAAVLPSFDRVELSTLVGRDAVAGAWPSLLVMANPDEASGRYVLSEALRRRVAAAVVRQRPWAEREWRRTAIRQSLSRARDGLAGDEGALQWHKLSRIARESPWWPWMNPASEADGEWQVRRDVTRHELPNLAALAANGLAANGLATGALASSGLPAPGLPVQALDGLWQASPAGFVVARDRSGRPVAFMLSVPLTRSTLPHLQALPAFVRPAGAAALAAAAREEGWLVWAHVAAAVPEVDGALVREALCDCFRQRRVLAPGPGHWSGPVGPQAAAQLGTLGFAQAASADLDLWRLDLERIGYEPWLNELMQPRTDMAIAERDWSEAVKEALTVLDEPEKLASTLAARFYGTLSGDRRPASVRAWLLDALATAELDDTPPSERVLLTLYYVDRLGPHEVVAERMNLPRTTYFRCHRRALVHLGESLFALRAVAERRSER